MEQTREEITEQFGKRVQRCYGCLIAFRLRYLYVADEVTHYCENCRDDSMFHLRLFPRYPDISKLREGSDEEHHHH